MGGINIQELENKAESELHKMRGNQAYRTAHSDIDRILAQRKSEAEDKHRKDEAIAWKELQQRVNRIESKVPEPKPEYKTWAFWFGLAGIVLAVIALIYPASSGQRHREIAPDEKASESMSPSRPSSPASLELSLPESKGEPPAKSPAPDSTKEPSKSQIPDELD